MNRDINKCLKCKQKEGLTLDLEIVTKYVSCDQCQCWVCDNCIGDVNTPGYNPFHILNTNSVICDMCMQRGYPNHWDTSRRAK